MFSREGGGVFVVGGASTDGTLLHDVWFRHVYGQWREIKTRITLGRVLAATYSFADYRLWVLDEVTEIEHGRERSRVRVLRVDPAGDTDIVFSTRRLRSDVTPFLSIDHDGSPLLAVARERRFSLYRLGPHPWRKLVRQINERRGTLVRAPIVDPNGYSFILSDADGNLLLDRVDRAPESHRGHHRHDDDWRAWWNRHRGHGNDRCDDDHGEQRGEDGDGAAFEGLF